MLIDGDGKSLPTDGNQNYYRMRESLNPNAKQVGQANRFGSPSNQHSGNVSAMDQNYNNSSSGKSQLLKSGLPPSGKILAQQSGTKNKGFKSAQRSSNFQRVGNSISGNNVVNQAQSMQNGHAPQGALKPGRLSHQVADEYNNLSENNL